MEIFELTKIIFENPEKYKEVSNNIKKKNFFMVNRLFSIQYPLQSHLLSHTKINQIFVVDFWQSYLRKMYQKTPYWMFTKGSVKRKKDKEKIAKIKDSTIVEFAKMYGYDIKAVKDAILFFPDKMKKEFKDFEKISAQIHNS